MSRETNLKILMTLETILDIPIVQEADQEIVMTPIVDQEITIGLTDITLLFVRLNI